mgnify:CR=1 FL=1
MKRRVLVCGPGPAARGGISAVIATHFAAGIIDPAATDFVATHRDGSRLRKAATYARAFLRVAAYLAGGRVGLVHLHSSSHASFLRKSGLALLARLAGVPVVFHVHNDELARWLGGGAGLRLRSLGRRVLGDVTVVALTPRLGERLRALDLPRDPAVLANPAPPTTPVPRPAERPPGPWRVLFLGGLTPAKGFADLLAAFALLAGRGIEAELRCGGVGDPAWVATALREFAPGRPVQLLGWVGDAERAHELAAADVLVLPSYTEGQPMTVIEAMAAGTPVVATAVGGVPETVADGTEALLVPPRDPRALADALARLHAEPALAARLAAAAKERARAVHSPAALRAQLAAIYRQAGYG